MSHQLKINENLYAMLMECHGNIFLAFHHCLPISQTVHLNYNQFTILSSKYHLIFNSIVLKTPFSLQFGIGKEMKVDNSAGVF